MKFDSLYLQSFGPFTDKKLDFSSEKASLHIITGHNEAGKSSLLRAVTAVLFGIEERTTDNFIHKNNQLRIGAALSRQDGEKFSFIRLKKRTKMLLDADGNPLDDKSLQNFWNTLDESVFRRQFGLDHEGLHTGGADLLAGGGDTGQSLFEAGAGLTGLHKILESLETRARELFLPLGSKPIINKALKRHKIAKDAVKKLAVKSGEWVRLNRECEEAKARSQAKGAELAQQRAARDRLIRIQRNVSLMGKRLAALQELQGLEDVPALAEDAAEVRKNTLLRQENAEADKQDAQADMQRIKAELAGLSVPEMLPAHARRIENLYQRSDGYRESANTLPEMQIEQRHLQQQAMTALRAVRPDLPLEQAETLRLPVRAAARIRALISEYHDLKAKSDSAQEREDELNGDLNEARQRLAACPAPPESAGIGGLNAAIETAKSHGHLENQHREMAAQARSLQQKIETKLETDAFWSGTLEEFTQLTVPLRETVEHFAAQEAELHVEEQRLNERHASLENRLKQLTTERKTLEEAGQVPTRGALYETRGKRDKQWQVLQQEYMEKTAKLDVLFTYTGYVTEADQIADRLYADSSRVAKHQRLSEDIQQATEELKECETQRGSLAERRDAYFVEWEQLCKPLGFTPATAKELNAWLRQRENLLEQLEYLQDKHDDAALQEQAITETKSMLVKAVRDTGLEEDSMPDSLAALLAGCQELQDKISQDNQKVIEWRQEIEKLEPKLANARRRGEAALTALENWRNNWSEAIQVLGLDRDAGPAEAEQQLNHLEALFSNVEKLQALLERVRNTEAKKHAYEQEAAELYQAFHLLFEQQNHPSALSESKNLPKGETEKADELAEKCYQRYKQAEKDRQRRNGLQERLQDAAAKQDKTETALNRCQEQLKKLCEQAACSCAAELPAVEEQAARKKALSRQIAEIEENLTAQNNAPLADILTEAEHEDQDALPSCLQMIEENIATLDKEQFELAETAGRLDEQLKQIDGSAKAAEQAQEGQEALAEIRDAADDYVQLKLSAELLKRTIKIYQEKNQGPLLKRAGNIFARLTLKAFSAVSSVYDEKQDKEVLAGVRPSGEMLRTEQMSTGTVDQLYFSLRLASIEQHLDGAEPTPLVVDDVLIQFDDRRSKAALQVLAEISAKTQVLLFTHHQHLVTLAQEAISAECLQVHQLH
ncbi:MAG: AAA family ATPase [Gammaproteobacteria bacterium]|nr:AAA family ATPase [Gammaproteobacteria bacterium]